MAEDAFAFLALLGVVEGDAVADGTGDQLVLQEGLLPDPLLVDNDQLRLLDALLVGLHAVGALLHQILNNISITSHKRYSHRA